MSTFSDDFNRANSNDLGPNYIEVDPSNDASIWSNELQIDSSTFFTVLVDPTVQAVFQRNQEASIVFRLNSSGSGFGPIVRGLSADGNTFPGGYCAAYDTGTGKVRLCKWFAFAGNLGLGSNLTVIGDYTVVLTPGDVLKIRAIDSTISVQINDVERISVIDTQYNYGQPGFASMDVIGISTWDDFLCSDEFTGNNNESGEDVEPWLTASELGGGGGSGGARAGGHPFAVGNHYQRLVKSASPIFNAAGGGGGSTGLTPDLELIAALDWKLVYNGSTNPWSATAKTISDLNGNTDVLYLIRATMHLEGNGTYLLLQPNADSNTANYSGVGRFINYAGGAPSDWQVNLNAKAGLPFYGSSIQEGPAIYEMFLWAETGQARVAQLRTANQRFDINLHDYDSVLDTIAMWKDTSANITSLKFAFTANCTGWGKVELYRVKWAES